MILKWFISVNSTFLEVDKAGKIHKKHGFYFKAISILTNDQIWDFFCQIGKFSIKIGKHSYFLALGTGPINGPDYTMQNIYCSTKV